MKIIRLMLVLAVAGLYGCSDKDAGAGGEDKTSLLENAGQADSPAPGSTDEAAAGSPSGATGETTLSADTAVQETQQLITAEVQAQADAAGAELAAAADSGQTAIDQAADSVSDAQNTVTKTVEAAGLETAAVGGDSIDSAQMSTGKAIYAKHCMACHAAGVAGAPKVSDAAVWEPRIAQGMDTLYGHAINGFKGSKGYMPPKGGFSTLHDDEVKAAVTYMVFASQ